MQTVMNAQQMREVDKYMMETLKIPGIVLMENAAMGAAKVIMDKVDPGAVVHVFCGTGNNGGDGLACARILLAHGYNVYLVIVGDSSSYKGDAASNYAVFSYLNENVLQLAKIEDLYSWRVPKAEIIVDALFGTGLDREVTGLYAQVIDVINRSPATRISLDIPSGISADNGTVLGKAVRADETVTFQFPKTGHFLYPGKEYSGKLTVVPIGVAAGVEDVVESTVSVIENNDPDMHLAERNPDTNKGSYGRLFIVAGSRGMAGAAIMTARAAYSAGAGLVTVGAPESIVNTLQGAVPEATCLPLPEQNGRVYSGSRVAVAQAMYRKTAMALGPGLGQEEGIRDMVNDVIGDASLCRVLDADALNAIGNSVEILAQMKGEIVFTPHPAEFARLLGMELANVLERPLELAVTFAKQFGVVLVLKGATTIIADTDGSAVLLAAGTPGMAKGGSGDVLTGTIAGFAAQGFSALDSALLGTYFCAMAGEAAAADKGTYSMTPLDTISRLGEVMMKSCSADPDAFHPEKVPSQLTERDYAAAAIPAVPAQPKPRLSTGAPKRPSIPVPAAPLAQHTADAEVEEDRQHVRQQTGRHHTAAAAAAAAADTALTAAATGEILHKAGENDAAAAVKDTEVQKAAESAAKEMSGSQHAPEGDDSRTSSGRPLQEAAPGKTGETHFEGRRIAAETSAQTEETRVHRSRGSADKQTKRPVSEDTGRHQAAGRQSTSQRTQSHSPADSIRRNMSHNNQTETARTEVSQETGRYKAVQGSSASASLHVREERRLGREDEQRRREEEERELVRAKLRNETNRQAAVQETDTPRSRAEAARQEADQASGVNIPSPQRTHSADTAGQTQRKSERQREIAQTDISGARSSRQEKTETSESEESTAALPNERQRTMDTGTVTQDTRIAPPVTAPSTGMQEAGSAADTRSDAQKHRDEVNAQIQRELKKQRHEKPVQRTRRRIG